MVIQLIVDVLEVDSVSVIVATLGYRKLVLVSTSLGSRVTVAKVSGKADTLVVMLVTVVVSISALGVTVV